MTGFENTDGPLLWVLAEPELPEVSLTSSSLEELKPAPGTGFRDPGPGIRETREIHRPVPDKVPKGPARGVQDTAQQATSESELRGPERELGVTLKSVTRGRP